MAQNIPIPSINEMDDHTFVSIKDAIQHFLCFETNIDGILIDKITSNYKNIVSKSSTASDSNAMQLIRDKVKANIQNSDLSPLIIYIILWSDDFEPNNVKQHKNPYGLRH